MRKFLAALVVVAATLLPFQAQAESQSPALYGVLFYADWCGSCKTLDPKLTKAKADSDVGQSDILFVRLDLTDKATKHQASLLASALDLDGVYAENAGKTGYLAIIDADTGKTVNRVFKNMSVDEITALIKTEISKSSS
ncbi:MAG: thioredoxin domain-containing protein [Pseudomonadota bacterium]